MMQGLARLHDGMLTAIELTKDDILEVRILDTEGNAHALTLLGLKKLKCSNFRQGNIVLDVSIATKEMPDHRSLCELYDCDYVEGASPGYVEQSAQEIIEGHLALVSVSPSYGCELLALCRQVKLDGETITSS
jgi:hypothetical protein